MARKKQIKPIEVKVETITAEHEELTRDIVERNQIRFRNFQRGLFGENYEPGTVKIKPTIINPMVDNLLRLEKEFILAKEGKHCAEETIKNYKYNFRIMYDFIGYNYLRQSKATRMDAIESGIEKARDIGASMPIIVLEADNIASYYHDWLKNIKKVKEQTIIHHMRHFRAIVYFAQEQKWIKEYDIPVVNVEPDIKPTFTKAELDAIVRKPRTDNFVEYRCWVMIKYLLATGNRISSMLALEVGDIDFEENCITVNTQKNKKPKLMPLVPNLRKVLREYIRLYRSDDDGNPFYDEPLFCNEYGQKQAYRSAYDAFAAYFANRGVEFDGFHKFRHSYAASWIRDGGNPFMLKEQLGHSTLAQTNRYANIYGMATKDEANEHSLINKVGEKGGRKKLRQRNNK